MHRNRRLAITAITAITAVATLGVAGCSPSPDNAESSTSAVAPAPPAAPSALPVTPSAPLPPPEALVDVLSRLADPNIPGDKKLDLVEGSTPDTAAALDRFTTAARDGGYLPMNFAANDLAWSATNPCDVVATVVVTTAQPENREFTVPMEFTPIHGGWQLSQRTSEMLLAPGNSRGSQTATPEPSPGPAPNPEPAPVEPAPEESPPATGSVAPSSGPPG